MRIAVACDHAGFPLKRYIHEAVVAMGCEVLDLGTNSTESVDYPDYAEKLAQTLLTHQADRGILLCGSGVGACIAANKIKGIYAAICHDTYSARQGVEHDNMNVLCLGARIIGPEVIRELVKSFLGAQFTAEERHVRRVGKTKQIEERGY
jgi:ribose 5-phosphate isomerase B